MAAGRLDDRQVADLFNRIDSDHDRRISLEELGAALKALRIPTSRATLDSMLRHMDRSGDGYVSEDEFVAFVRARRQRLRVAFDSIVNCAAGPDRSDRKTFGAAALRRAATLSGLTISDDDTRAIMARLDSDKDSAVTFDEFVDALLLVPEVNPRAALDQWFISAFVDDAKSEFTVAREIRPSPSEENVSFAMLVAKKLICGGLAGCVSRTLTAPVDRFRILMMAAAERMTFAAALAAATSHGWRGLFIGNGVNCVKIAPEVGIKLLAFDLLKHACSGDPENITSTERFFAGGLAGAVSQASIYPLEVVRTRMSIAPRGEFKSVAHCFRRVVETGGVRALYSGLGPSVVGIIPYAAIDLGVNSLLKDAVATHLQKQGSEVSVPVLLAVGMASSAVAMAATFPLNVIRTRAQATGRPSTQIIKEVSTGGVRAFYRGILLSSAKVLPATSISYAAYDWLVKQWDARI